MSSAVNRSPGGMKPKEDLTIAILRKTQGRVGELAAEILTDFRERFEKARQVRLVQPDGRSDFFDIERFWFHKNRVVLKFSGVDTLGEAQALVGCEVRIPRSEAVELPKGHHFRFELVGCLVVDDESGRGLGRVKEFLEYRGSPLLAVEADQGEWLLPFAASMCSSIDVQRREIRVRLPEGLEDLNT